jgi:uncharacterized integral membrane protein
MALVLGSQIVVVLGLEHGRSEAVEAERLAKEQFLLLLVLLSMLLLLLLEINRPSTLVRIHLARVSLPYGAAPVAGEVMDQP